MQDLQSKFGNHSEILIKIMPLLAFAVPMLWLFLLYPESFELMWKGRTFQLFFVWLIALELILGWENIKTKINKFNSLGTLALAISVFLPTFYIIISNYFGLNEAVASISSRIGIQWWASMPLSIEYIVFAFFFCLMIYLVFGKNGIKNFVLPAFFLGIVGTLYMIDNIFPYGQFSPFQIFVPSAAILAAGVLGVMGYETFLEIRNDPNLGSLPRLTVIDPANSINSVTFDIAWPCAGIESLLIFSVVALLFLKRVPMSKKAKVGYSAGVESIAQLSDWDLIDSFSDGHYE